MHGHLNVKVKGSEQTLQQVTVVVIVVVVVVVVVEKQRVLHSLRVCVLALVIQH